MMNMTTASREARISCKRARKERFKAMTGKILYVVAMLFVAAVFLVVPFNFNSVEFGVLSITSGSGKSWLDVLLTFNVSSPAWICSILYALVAIYAAILAVYCVIRILIWLAWLAMLPIIIILMVLFDFLHGRRPSRMEENTKIRNKCEKAFESIRRHGRFFSWLFRMGAIAIVIPSVLLWEDKGFDKLFAGPGLMLIAFFAVAMIFHFICRSIHGRVRPVAIYEVGYTYEVGGMVDNKSQMSGYMKPKAMISREGSIIEARDRERLIGRYVLRNFFQNIFGLVMLMLFVCASNITTVNESGELAFNLETPQMMQASLFLFLMTRVLKHMTWSFEYDFDGLDAWIKDKRLFYKIACTFVSILGILSGVMLGFDGIAGILLVVIGVLALIEFIIDCKLSADDEEDDEEELEEGEFKVYATPYGMYNEHHYYGRAHFPKTPDTRYNEYNCVYDDDWDD